MRPLAPITVTPGRVMRVIRIKMRNTVIKNGHPRCRRAGAGAASGTGWWGGPAPTALIIKRRDQGTDVRVALEAALR